MSILTPEAISWEVRSMQAFNGEGLGFFTLSVPQTHALADTLAAYAEVVQKVAEANEWCGWQGVSGLVLDEEAWLKARELRGLA